MFSFRRLLLDPKGDEGSGGGSSSQGSETSQKAAENFVAKYGDVTKAVMVLMGETHDLREKNRKLTEQLPSEGSLTLTAEDVNRWKAYRELGKPEDLRRIVAEHTTLTTENAGFKREKELARVTEVVSKALGKKVNPGVLSRLSGDLTFQVEPGKVRDEKGKEVDGEVVLVKDGDAKPVAFADYAKANWAEFLPALFPEQATTARPIGTPRRETHTGLPKPDESNPLADLEASLRDTGSGSF